MKVFEINIFVVRRDWEVIQADAIWDWYNIVNIASSMPKEARKEYGIYTEQEAYTMCGTYWPYTMEIIKKPIIL